MERSTRTAWLAFGALLLPYAWLVNRFWFVCDDAFITFRYSRNWAQGHGPRYNLADAQPVEGYSDFLWMAIAAAVEASPLDVVTVMPAISVMCGVGVLVLVHHVLLGEARVRPVAAWGATLVLATFPPFAVWSTSGLETMPQTVLMLLTWWLLSRPGEGRGRLVLAALTGVALALIRTEGLAWFTVLVGVAGVQRRLEGRALRPLLPVVGVVFAAFGVYEAWRVGYYGAWVANTAHAKVHMGPAALLRGASYLGLYATTHLSPLLLIPAIPLALGGSRRPLAVGASLFALAVPAYAVVVSGDYMTYFRLLVPGLPWFALTLGLALDALASRRPASLRWLPLAAVLTATVGVLPALDVHLVPRRLRAALDVREKQEGFRSENEQWMLMDQHTRFWRERGEAIAAHAPPGSSIVAGAIGSLGYYADVHVYDRNGLVSREVAAIPWDGRLRSPGHDKTVDAAFFLDKKPTFLDAKVLYGPMLGFKIRASLLEMRAKDFSDRYYPEILPFGTMPGTRVPRVLVWLRRGETLGDVDAGWTRFKTDIKGIDRR
ncbi:MAG: hypothetical protein H6732_15410 [Alphaproteobacteria bacterium]|nr:hypothetical protein [Alphaproteobacteria bacterium]